MKKEQKEFWNNKQQEGSTKSTSYLMMMLSAPSGVTRIAGAKAYAAKLATSPTITGK
jgi:hypothetical protein